MVNQSADQLYLDSTLKSYKSWNKMLYMRGNDVQLKECVSILNQLEAIKTRLTLTPSEL